MFEKDKARYMTKGIASGVPMELQLFLWAILEREEEKHGMDYLQVFQLAMEENGTLRIDYSQEIPEWKQTYRLAAVGGTMPKELHGEKIYVIDDETHVTMLFANEY